MLVELLVVAVVMGVLDGLWLTVLARRFYRSHIGAIMRQRVDAVAAGLFYVMYVVGVVVLAVRPAESTPAAIGLGALLGAVAYGTYDLTNRATVEPFPWAVVAVDMAWGTFLTAAAAGAAYGIG